MYDRKTECMPLSSNKVKKFVVSGNLIVYTLPTWPTEVL